MPHTYTPFPTRNGLIPGRYTFPSRRPIDTDQRPYLPHRTGNLISQITILRIWRRE